MLRAAHRVPGLEYFKTGRIAKPVVFFSRVFFAEFVRCQWPRAFFFRRILFRRNNNLG